MGCSEIEGGEMIGEYVSFKDFGTWLYGKILDFKFSQKDNTWLFFLALYSETGTRLAVVPCEEIRCEDMRKYNETQTNQTPKIQ